MSGLEKILQVIEAQGQQNADAMKTEAQRKAAIIREDGARKAEEVYQQQLDGFRRSCDIAYANACAAADAAKKRELLACKVQCVEQAVRLAMEQAASLPDDAYFAVILGLIRTHLQKGCGTISFGKKDLDRLPEDFAQQLSQLDSESSFIIADTPAEIENGFVLSYGRISENCSFAAIAEAEQNQIRDKAAAVLF